MASVSNSYCAVVCYVSSIRIYFSFLIFQLVAYYKEHNLTTLWISDDESESKDLRAPVVKRMQQDVARG